MSDYSQITTFTTKDSLSSGDPEKIISGADVDAEFGAISTAIATKYDSDDLASQAQAEAGVLNTKLMTPLRTQNWADANGGLVGEIQALADPNADGLLGWDDGAGAGSNVIFFTMGTGLAFNTTTIEISHLGFEDLTDPNADRLIYWDDSDGALNWLTIDNGITIDSDDTMGLTDVAATTTNPIDVTSGSITIDLTALTNIEGSALAATDEFLVDDGGTPKAVAVQDMGLRVQTGQTTQTLAANDMNSIMKFTGTATLTIDENVTVDIPVGVPVVLVMDHATQELTVQADTSVTLESVFHPGGTANASDKVVAGGMAVLVQTETDVWQLSGDIADS